MLNSQNNDKEIHTFSSILNQPNIENKNVHRLVEDYKFNQHFISEDSINFFEDHLKTIKDNKGKTYLIAAINNERPKLFLINE